MVCTVKPKPRGPLVKMTGGLRLVTNGDNSLHGDVSRELHVLEPPGDCTGWIGAISSAGIIRLRPVAEALLITARGAAIRALLRPVGASTVLWLRSRWWTMTGSRPIAPKLKNLTVRIVIVLHFYLILVLKKIIIWNAILYCLNFLASN